MEKSKGFTLIVLLIGILIIAVLISLTVSKTNIVPRGDYEPRNVKRKADTTQIRSAIESWKVNGGEIIAPITNTTYDITKDDLENIGSPFNKADNNGKKPSDYLSGSSYPEDPQSDNSNSYYYRITIRINGTYQIKRDDSDPIPSDNVTDKDVPPIEG